MKVFVIEGTGRHLGSNGVVVAGNAATAKKKYKRAMNKRAELENWGEKEIDVTDCREIDVSKVGVHITSDGDY